MNLEQQVVSLDLAKRLKELGVKQEGEFYWVITLTTEYHLSWYSGSLPKALEDRNDVYSAFTVAELGEIIFYTDKFFPPRYDIDKEKWQVELVPVEDAIKGEAKDFIYTDTEADSRAKMLIYLLENNLITI